MNQKFTTSSSELTADKSSFENAEVNKNDEQRTIIELWPRYGCKTVCTDVNGAPLHAPQTLNFSGSTVSLLKKPHTDFWKRVFAVDACMSMLSLNIVLALWVLSEG